MGEILNCTWPYRDAQCPRHFCTILRPTAYPNVAICESCLASVHLCRTPEQAAALMRRGELVAKGFLFPDEPPPPSRWVAKRPSSKGGVTPTGVRATIFIAIIDPEGEEDYDWVQAWFARWGERVRIEKDSSSDPDFLLDVEGPAEAIAEIPERMLCGSEWSSSQPQERGGKTP